MRCVTLTKFPVAFDAGTRLNVFCEAGAIAETRPGEPWRAWPESLRDPDGPHVDQEAATVALTVFPGHLHRSAMMQRGHKGLRARQT